MRMVPLSVILLLVFITLSCTGDQNAVIHHSPFVPEGYKISFHDEFETLVLDTAGDGSQAWAPWWVGWNARYLRGNDEKAWKCDFSYTGSGKEALGITLHEITRENTLMLYGRETPSEKSSLVNNMPYIGGMISADQSYSQTFGYFEIRCRFNISKGHHWGIWMVPADNSWPPEIDILEVVGHQADIAFMNAHWKEEGKHTSDMVMCRGINTADFHTYAFEWRADSLIWSLDGKVCKRQSNYIYDPMYFIVSPEIGGEWPGMPDSTTIWPTTCEIDYIRIYAKEHDLK